MSRVGQFFGKLFSGAGPDEAVLRAYGKLPLYAEYRRLEVSPGAPLVFSQWLDEGRLAWVRSTENDPRGQTRSSRVALRWPDSREWIVANIWDSRDSLGRVFPLAFFVVCPPESLGKTRLERWISCAAIHEYLDREHTRLATLGTGGDFYRVYRQHPVPIRLPDLPQRAEELLARAREIEFAPWFQAADLPDIEPGAWFASLLRRAERWKAQPEMLAELGLSCPLAAGIPHSVQAAVWLEWVSTLPAVANKDPWLIAPSTRETGPARLHIVFRDLLPGDFQLLTSDATRYNYVEDLGTVGETAVGGDAQVSIAAPSGSLLAALTRPTQQ